MSGVSPPRARPGAPNENNGSSGLMTLISAVVIVASLSIARDVLIPIALAVLLSFVLAPLVNVLRRVWLGRVPAVLIAVLLALGVILGVGGLIGAQVAGLAGDIPRYTSTIEHKVQAIQGATIGRLSTLVDRMTKQIDRGSHASTPAGRMDAGGSPGAAPADPANPAGKPTPVEVHQPDLSPTELAQRVLEPILSPLATTGIVVVVAIFILLRQDDLRDRLIRLFGTDDLHRTMTAMDEAAHRLSRYFLTLLALNTMFGCVIGLGLFAIGVQSPMLWGIVAILMRFVPYIGALLSAVLPVALAAALDPGWSMVLWTVTLFVVCEAVMAQVVEPMAYGRSTGLSPLSVVVAAIFWAWLWGPIGLVLSMPLTLCLVVLGRHVERLNFLDVLLGDRPALTPVESFYNRMLAGHVDEVQDDAEQLLKVCSLSTYYDEVAIPGLRLATADIGRGVLTEAQTARIVGGVKELLDELADYDDDDDASSSPEDAAPAGLLPDQRARLSPLPVSQGNSAVLCVAGRGPLDEVASALVAQLLGKRGLEARVVPHAAVNARAAVAALDMTDVATICLTYVGISGTSSHLRYTVRRLRARNPTALILVGLWPADMAGDNRLRAAVAADAYAASLREMVATCLAQALGSAERLATTDMGAGPGGFETDAGLAGTLPSPDPDGAAGKLGRAAAAVPSAIADAASDGLLP